MLMRFSMTNKQYAPKYLKCTLENGWVVDYIGGMYDNPKTIWAWAAEAPYRIEIACFSCKNHYNYVRRQYGN